jgi:signal transduction histidine kinase
MAPIETGEDTAVTTGPDLLGAYGEVLTDYLHTASEEALYRASLLSTSFIEHGLGPEEIVALHSEELERVAARAPMRERARLYASSLQFLLEVMIAYGLRYKEYVDLKLTETTREVEQRLALERAVAEEKIRAETASLRSKEEFLYFIAHELRTPLTALRGHIQLLQRRQQRQELDPERLRKSLDGMAHAALGLQRVVSNLLEISHTEAGSAPAEALSAVDLGVVANQLAQELEVVAAEAHVTIEVQVTGDLPPVRAPAQALQSVVNNLLANAIKYSHDGGTVRVRLCTADGEVRCVVEDDGIGIAADDLPHIFEKYYRGANAVVAVQGIGLGLAVALATVQRCGGRLEVQSTVDVGSTFTLALPAAESGAGAR